MVNMSDVGDYRYCRGAVTGSESHCWSFHRYIPKSQRKSQSGITEREKIISLSHHHHQIRGTWVPISESQ